MRSYEFILDEAIERREPKPYYARHDKKSADRARIRSQARKGKIENAGHIRAGK